MQVRDALVCVSARCDELLSLSWLISYVFPLWERTACRVCAFVSARRRVPRVSVCEKREHGYISTVRADHHITLPSVSHRKKTDVAVDGCRGNVSLWSCFISRHRTELENFHIRLLTSQTHARVHTHTPTQTCLISFHPLILLLILVCASEDPLRGNMLPLLNLAHNHNQTHALNYWDSL